MQFVIDDELSFGPRLAVDKLNRILNSCGKWGLELDAPGEETAFLIGLPDRSAVVDGALAAAADGNYADDLVFGFREKRHCGHWRDDLAVAERDLATIAKLTPHGETIHVETMLWPGGEIHPQPPRAEFTPPDLAQAGRDLLLRLDVTESEERSARSVRCFHRIAHQALDFEVIDMRAEESGFSTAIPGNAIDPAWDLMLFFEFKFSDGSATRWPDWRTETPYFVIPTQ